MKKKIALFTPLHPQKTGIADWIEEMLPYLREILGSNYQIDLFVDDCVPSEEDTVSNHKIFEMDSFESIHNDYDLPIYQMGNNNFHCKIYNIAMKYPGLVISHDFAIHHMVACIHLEHNKNDVSYFEAVRDNHGNSARDLAYQRAVDGELGLWETDAIDYPMNRTLIKNSKGVIVFSEFAKRRIQSYHDFVPVHRIYLHCSGKAKKCTLDEVEKARKHLRLNLREKESLICVFGFIGHSKRPYSILKAAKKLQKLGFKFKLIYVGKLQEECKDLLKKINEYGLKNKVTVTGFTSIEDFDAYVRAADVCISLRYPTMGETSGVLMRALRYGKPAIVTNVGTFQEFSEEMVTKIDWGENEVKELSEALISLISDEKKRKIIEKNAVSYASKYLEPYSTAESCANFIKELIHFEEIKKNDVYRHTRDKMVSTYFELGKTDEKGIEEISETLISLV